MRSKISTFFKAVGTVISGIVLVLMTVLLLYVSYLLAIAAVVVALVFIAYHGYSLVGNKDNT